MMKLDMKNGMGPELLRSAGKSREKRNGADQIKDVDLTGYGKLWSVPDCSYRNNLS